MTHEPETTIEEAVYDWFADQYGGGSVETQVYQPGPYWYVDVVVDLGFGRLYIEVENDAGSVRPGVAQAIGYAAADPSGGIPMVITPKGHVDDARLERLRRGPVIIREFDEETGEFV